MIVSAEHEILRNLGLCYEPGQLSQFSD